jgi:hypothetical protein
MKSRNIIKYCISICVILNYCNCAPFDRVDIDFPNTENVKIELLGDSSLIALPLEMIKCKNLLLISDYRGDSLLWVFDTTKKQMIKRWACKGIGPDEFQSPIQMAISDTTLMLYNRWHYDLKQVFIDVSSVKFDIVNHIRRLPTDIDKIYPLNKGLYIASGRFKEGRYAILNSSGDIINYFGDYPNYIHGEDKIPNFPKFMFHQACFTYNSNSNKLASIDSHVLEIIDCSQYLPKIETRNLLSTYDYTYDSGDGWATARARGNTKEGIRYICSTSKYLYAIFNPNVSDNNVDKEQLLNEIWIFDWNGNPVKKIYPDIQVKCLYVENDDKTVYCMVEAPEPAIAMFEIK